MQFQKPILIQEQRLKMSPQLYQSIQLMAMPIQDLKARIQEELEKNPALEVIEDRSTVSIEEVPKKQSESDEYAAFENSSDPGYSRSGGSDSDGDSKRRFLEGALSRPESLHDHLIWQLRLQKIPESWFRIGELLIRNLDAHGFHIEDPALLFSDDEHDSMREVMQLIQGFEPTGTCVRDSRESLLVQAELDTEAPDGAVEVLKTYIDLLEKEKLGEIARKMKRGEEEIRTALTYIRTLNPYPGSCYSSEPPAYVTPDVMVKMKEGEFVIILNDEEIPVLGISDFFAQLAAEKERKERELKQYLNANLRNAQWFMRSIHQRNQTLLKVTRVLVEFQREFFRKGPKYLVPLTLKDIAREIGVHEATVSRITTNKYIQTEWGIFELKYFFSNSISGAGSTGSRFSKEGVKQIIKEILVQEISANGRKHLSDQKLSELLAQRGIKIARRTVAKYRNELDISSSYER